MNAKENSITIVSPLVKTVGTGVNQLSLDTTAAYNVGSLTATGKITCNSLTLNGTAMTDLGGYATTTALNAKENLLTVVSPLVKTTVLTGPLAGMNQLSFDSFAVYNVGQLNCNAGVSVSQQILCGNIGTGPNALSIQNQAGVEVAKFWSNASKSTNIFGDLSVDGTTFLKGSLSCNGTVSGTGLSTYI